MSTVEQNNEQENTVEMTYQGPDGLVFEEIAIFNDGNRRAEKGQTYSVDEATAEDLDIYEGWSRSGDKNVTEELEAQQDSGDESMEDLNARLAEGGEGYQGTSEEVADENDEEGE